MKLRCALRANLLRQAIPTIRRAGFYTLPPAALPDFLLFIKEWFFEIIFIFKHQFGHADLVGPNQCRPAPRRIPSGAKHRQQAIASTQDGIALSLAEHKNFIVNMNDVWESKALKLRNTPAQTIASGGLRHVLQRQLPGEYFGRRTVFLRLSAPYFWDQHRSPPGASPAHASTTSVPIPPSSTMVRRTWPGCKGCRPLEHDYRFKCFVLRIFDVPLRIKRNVGIHLFGQATVAGDVTLSSTLLVRRLEIGGNLLHQRKQAGDSQMAIKAEWSRDDRHSLNFFNQSRRLNIAESRETQFVRRHAGSQFGKLSVAAFRGIRVAAIARCAGELADLFTSVTGSPGTSAPPKKRHKVVLPLLVVPSGVPAVG